MPERRFLDRATLLVAAVSTLIGGVIGWAVQALAESLGNLELWLFLITATVALITCTLLMSTIRGMASVWTEKQELMLDVANDIRLVVNSSVPHYARLIPRDSVYPEMAHAIRHAKREVAVITFFMYDWEKGIRTFVPADEGAPAPGRDDFYRAILECISDPTVEYIRVWQVPKARRGDAAKAIALDPLHKQEMEMIERISRDKPDQARFIIADEHTTASFVLVDRRSLFINIDFYEPDEGVWYSPYMLFITDANGEAFVDLKSVIVRLTSRLN
ncbi:hypothetical protein V6W11_10710 [Micromonospora profundi]